MMSVQTERKRNVNMDFLRIIAMVMVTMLHALAKSDLLPFMGADVSANGWIAWVLEVLSIAAVNIYMLISGYFLVTSKFKVSRLVEIVFQTMFYLMGTFILFGILGKFPAEDMTIYNLLHYFLPIHMATYWFISAYIIILLLLPLIANGAHSMSEKQLQGVVLWMLLFTCVIKSVLPVRLQMDDKGYSFLWYLTLFLVGAYIRLHGFKMVKTAAKGWILFGVSTFLILAEIFVLSQISVRTGRLKEMITVSLEYNHILVFCSALGIFAAFLHAKPLGEKFGRVIYMISPYCLGVYLFQESPVVRYLWQDWFGLRESIGDPVPVFVLRVFSSVITMFVLGICLDMIRAGLFRIITHFVYRRKNQHVGVECDSSGL